MRSVKNALQICHARVVPSGKILQRIAEGGVRREEELILLPGTCHLPKLKILEHAPYWRGDKGNGCSYEGRRRRAGDAVYEERYEIRNWARESRDRLPVGVGRRMGLLLWRGEKSVVLLCFPPGKEAADVPTRLARARCHLAAKKTVPSAPSSSLPPCPRSSTPSLSFRWAPAVPFLAIVATGQWYEITISHRECIQAPFFIRESTVVDPPTAETDPTAIRSRKAYGTQDYHFKNAPLRGTALNWSVSNGKNDGNLPLSIQILRHATSTYIFTLSYEIVQILTSNLFFIQISQIYNLSFIKSPNISNYIEFNLKRKEFYSCHLVFSLIAPIYYRTYVIISEKIKSPFFSLLWIDMIARISCRPPPRPSGGFFDGRSITAWYHDEKV